MHHQNLLPGCRLIIFDNESTDATLIKAYEDISSDNVFVFSFSGNPDHIHCPSNWGQLYEALRRSSDYYAFFDVDEFLYCVSAEGNIISLEQYLLDCKSQRILCCPSHWALSEPLSEKIYHFCSDELLRGGKPVMSSEMCTSNLDIINHNVQLFGQLDIIHRCRGGLVLFHQRDLNPTQRIKVNTLKCLTYNFIESEADIHSLLAGSLDDIDPATFRNYLVEISRLRDIAEHGLSDSLRFKHGAITLNKEYNQIVPTDLKAADRLGVFVNNFPDLKAAFPPR
ncbi:hypothetical protein [Cyanobium usitatum]|uniref:hypothetical protein n=1 Tax=Cyanobium usitatum TaxID=2304190 RepID=UPI002AD3597C|nr:hypothetical protein [Cyanobium usitatum]